MSNKSILFAVLFVAAIVTAVCAWKYSDISAMANAPAISKEAKAHILHGDKTGGGHLYGTGRPCKTEFPKDWDEAEIISNVRKVAANDNLKWKKGKNGYYTATQNIDNVKMQVVLDKERDGVVTAYPLNGKANSCKAKSSNKSAARKKLVPAQAKVEPSAQAGSAVANSSNRQPRTSNINNR